jgi:hypothetical protein
MADYTNWGQPRFRLVDARLAERIITLPVCNSEGEPEDFENEGVIIHKTLKGKLVTVNTLGNQNVFRIKWTLKYNRHITGSDCIELAKILNHNSQLSLSTINKIHMAPYYDSLSGDIIREFEVIFTSKNFAIDIKKGGRKADGMYITDLEFTTVNLYPIEWILAGTPEAGYVGDPGDVTTGQIIT